MYSYLQILVVFDASVHKYSWSAATIQENCKFGFNMLTYH